MIKDFVLWLWDVGIAIASLTVFSALFILFMSLCAVLARLILDYILV